MEIPVYIREFEQGERLAAKALEMSEKQRFPYPAALSRCVLGRARAELGDGSRGIALIRDGIAGLLEIGSGFGATSHMAYLSEAQEREGALSEACQTLEQAFEANPDELVYRPEISRVRGEIRLKLGQKELAEGRLSRFDCARSRN